MTDTLIPLDPTVLDFAVKPGVQTTEFWLACLAIIAAVTLTLAGDLPASDAMTAIAAVVAGYGVSRGLAKR